MKTLDRQNENMYYLKPKYVMDARYYLDYPFLDLSKECISELCGISYEEANEILMNSNGVPIEFISSLCGISYEGAKEIMENYQNSDNKNAYIFGVASMLQQQAETSKITR